METICSTLILFARSTVRIYSVTFQRTLECPEVFQIHDFSKVFRETLVLKATLGKVDGYIYSY